MMDSIPKVNTGFLSCCETYHSENIPGQSVCGGLGDFLMEIVKKNWGFQIQIQKPN